jgi:hypothetical protein
MHPQRPPLRRSPQGACIPPDLPPDRASPGFLPRVFGVLGGGEVGRPNREVGFVGRGVECVLGGGFRGMRVGWDLLGGISGGVFLGVSTFVGLGIFSRGRWRGL